MPYIVKTLGHSFYYTLSNILTQGADFLMLPLYARVISIEQVGVIALLGSLLGFLNIIFKQGLIPATSKFYFDFKNDEEVNKYLNTLVTYLLISGLVLTVIGTWIAFPMGEWMRIDPLLIVLVMVIAYANSITSFYQTILTAQERSHSFLSNKLFQTVAVILMIVVSIFFYQANALGKITGEVIGALLVVMISLFLLFHRHKVRPIVNKLSYITKSIGFGLPVQLAGLGWWGMVNIDRFFLNHFTGAKSVAIYSVAYVAALSINLFSTGFNQAWSIFYFKHHKTKDFLPNSKKLIEEYAGWLFILLLTVLFFSRELILILGGGSYLPGVVVVPWIVLAAALYGLYFIPSRKLFVSEQTWSLVTITIIGLTVNLTANFLLVPPYGMMGAAYATTIAYLISLLVTLYVTKDTTWIKTLTKPVYFLACGLSLIAIVGVLSTNLDIYMSFLVRLLVWGIGLVVAWKYQIFDGDIIKGFFTKDERTNS